MRNFLGTPPDDCLWIDYSELPLLKQNYDCSTCKFTAELFFRALLGCTSLRVLYCNVRYPSITPVDQLRRQLGVRCFSTWYYTRPWVGISPLTQDVNWTYIRRSEDVLHVFWTSYVRSIYVLCLRDINRKEKVTYRLV